MLDFNPKKMTGGAKRFKEIIYSLLDKGDVIHLFIPPNADLKEHSNLIRHDIVCKNNRFIPNGFLNLLSNFRKLLTIKSIKYDGIIVFEISYAIQCVLLNLKKIKLFIRQDFIEYRSIDFDEKKINPFFRFLLKKIYLYTLTIIEKIVLFRVDKIVIQSNYEKDYYEKTQKLKKKRFKVCCY